MRVKWPSQIAHSGYFWRVGFCRDRGETLNFSLLFEIFCFKYYRGKGYFNPLGKRFLFSFLSSVAQACGRSQTLKHLSPFHRLKLSSDFTSSAKPSAGILFIASHTHPTQTNKYQWWVCWQLKYKEVSDMQYKRRKKLWLGCRNNGNHGIKVHQTPLLHLASFTPLLSLQPIFLQMAKKYSAYSSLQLSLLKCKRLEKKPETLSFSLKYFSKGSRWVKLGRVPSLNQSTMKLGWWVNLSDVPRVGPRIEIMYRHGNSFWNHKRR